MRVAFKYHITIYKTMLHLSHCSVVLRWCNELDQQELMTLSKLSHLRACGTPKLSPKKKHSQLLAGVTSPNSGVCPLQ